MGHVTKMYAAAKNGPTTDGALQRTVLFKYFVGLHLRMQGYGEN